MWHFQAEAVKSPISLHSSLVLFSWMVKVEAFFEMVELHNETIFIGEKEKQTKMNFVQVRNELLLFRATEILGFLPQHRPGLTWWIQPIFIASVNSLMLLSHFSRVRLCATPETAAHQALLSLGFSRQEHWSALPFPSLMHESEKWKWSHSVVSDSSQPHGLQPTRLLFPWDFPGKSTGVGCHCLLLSPPTVGQFLKS